MPLVRGFKAEAERRAAAVWQGLETPLTVPIDLRMVAAGVGARVVMADELIDMRRLEQLEEIQPFGFSACTFEVDGGHAVILNPLRSSGRQRADCAHELAHLLLRHQMRVPERVGDYVFFTGNVDQEDEANWFAGCLLLPRSAVLKAVYTGMDAPALAEHFETTEEMARFRINATGAAAQAAHRRSMTVSR